MRGIGNILLQRRVCNVFAHPDAKAVRYKITKEQLEQLGPYVRKLHEVTEKICKEKIEAFGV